MLRACLALAALVALFPVKDVATGDGHPTGPAQFGAAASVLPDSSAQVLPADLGRDRDVPEPALWEAALEELADPTPALDITSDMPQKGARVLGAVLSAGGDILHRARGLLPGLAQQDAQRETKLWLARVSPEQSEAAALDLPASFTGTAPCKDCEDVHYILNLWPDRVFHLRRVWEGKNMQRDAIGRWSVDPATDVLTLHGDENDLKFELLGPDRLRRIGGTRTALGDGRMLEVAPAFQAFDPSLPLRGPVTWSEERATFVECTTGRRYPLKDGGDYELLEHAYLAAGIEPGMPLMASFDGSILQGWRAEDGQGEVVVKRFVGVWPGETCEGAPGGMTLRNTYWRLLKLGEAEVAATANRREPSLILREGERRFSATVGCNPIAGRFTLDDESLRFGQIHGGRLGCPAALAALEEQLKNGLEATATWRISGQLLELLDAEGAQIALLQAVHLY